MCAWQFGDSFDCYATTADMANGYWDTLTLAPTLIAGRFAGSQALHLVANFTLIKSSGVNDAVHHVVMAVRQTAALSGTSTVGGYLTFYDGTTGQCTICFRSDGAIILASGASAAGTLLATYAGAVTAINTWFAFEFEITINNTTGRFRVRKNGNPADDFDSGAVLDTQNSANAYANKLQVGCGNSIPSIADIDDLYWRSDATSVPWLGDIKCMARAPASDASVQFSRSAPVYIQPGVGSSTANVTTGTARYTPVVAAYTGSVSAVSAMFPSASTCNMKCSIFASSGTAPTTVLGSATVTALSAASSGTFTFGTQVPVVKGTQYWVGIESDATSGQTNATSGTTGLSSTTAYAAFPVASPATIAAQAPNLSMTINTNVNADFVNEPQQDATTSYVYDSVPGHADLYGIAAIASTPLTTYAVTTRAYMIKSDAGTRTAAVQLKSGSSTVASPTVVLTPSNWQWAWRHDPLDPATGAAWTAAAVNVCTIGPTVIA